VPRLRGEEFVDIWHSVKDKYEVWNEKHAVYGRAIESAVRERFGAKP
jgi:hypothetical protein